MGERIPQSTSYLLIFKAYLLSTGLEATGVTIAITISKNGATSFSNPNAGATNATEMASGWYKVTLDTTDTGTLGPLAVRGTSATIQDVGVALTVVKATNAGLTALPDTAATTNASLLTSGTGTDQLSVSSGVASANATQIAGAATPATNIGKTGAAIVRGTVTTGGSTTSVPTSALTINGSAASGVVASQFVGRVMLFDGNTTTAGLQGAASTISASTASNTPTFTVGTLPASVASGDTFSIV